MPASPARVAVVIATRNRGPELLGTLTRLRALDEQPPIVVVDNGSGDGTAELVRTHYPDVQVVGLRRNWGGAARTVGARLVDPEERLDPVCREMAHSPLGRADDLPGPSVLGFIACGAVVRRSAFLEVGGFDARLGVGGEEELLSVDLAAGGWGLAYVDEVVAYHHPSPSRDPSGRHRVQVRNALWSAWLRRPLGGAARQTAQLAALALHQRGASSGLLLAVLGLPWVLRERRPVPRELEAALRTLAD